MNPLSLSEIALFIEQNIGSEFHEKKLRRLSGLKLDDIVKRKNPYLFKTKGYDLAHDYIKSVFDAALSSGEETMFGDFLEKVAIFVCEKVHGGRKSGIPGIDLEFEAERDKYLITIKSGPNWGNSSQIKGMVNSFTSAKKSFSTSGGARNMRIICVEGCCYGKDKSPDKGTHVKLCVERFWDLISGSANGLYQDIIEPLGHRAKERNEELNTLFSRKMNELTAEFISRFCVGAEIDWHKLLFFNSGKQ